MATLNELHEAYMRTKEKEFDNYNFDDEEYNKTSDEYCSNDEDVIDVHWEPVAKPVKGNFFSKNKYYGR